MERAHETREASCTRVLFRHTPPTSIDCRMIRVEPGKPDKQVAEVAGRQWGVVSLHELRGCGLSNDAVDARVEAGRLHRLHMGVYSVGHANPPLEGRFLAAVKACGTSAVLSHRSAAAHLGLLEWDGRLVEVTVPGTAPHDHDGVYAHRSLRMGDADRTVHRGLPVTSPARTLVDLAGCLGHKALRRVVREAQALRLASIPEILDALERAGRRRGSRKLRQIIATGPAPTRTVLEDVVLELILDGGLEHPDVNAPMRVGGRRVVPDFRWPARRLVVEADGGAWHDHKLAREDDAERQALLEAHGERVVRVTWAQAVARPAETLARLRAAGAPSSIVGSPVL
jgi:very-short-patch-repair endonuclease